MITLKNTFSTLRKAGKKAFVAYIPFGFPRPSDTAKIILSLQEGGADIIEIGIPFSDPLADGPIIQKASFCALEKGATIERFLTMLAGLKRKITVPLVVMTYYNPLFRYGMETFFRKLRAGGVTGIMIVDLPIEESGEYVRLSRKHKLENVFFVTPTTTQERVKKIAAASRGFLYYISVTGITGPRRLSVAPLLRQVKALKKATQLPVCVGFGIHSRAQVETVGKGSDGVIVGSSIVSFIEKHVHRSDFGTQLIKYIQSLKGKDRQ